jgi:transposase
MLTIPSTVKLFAAVNPVDFRRGIDGLAAIVESEFGIEAMSGDIFIFLNRRANQVRLLFWERDGFCLLTKRLEAGTFRRLKRERNESSHVELEPAELVLLLEGIDVASMQRRKRYIRGSNGEKITQTTPQQRAA